MSDLKHPQHHIQLDQKYGARNYDPLDVVLTRGEGVWLWDVNGKKYLDMMSAYSAVSHGHSHPRILNTLIRQAGTLSMCSRAYYNDILPQFYEKLCHMTRMDKVLPMNTGAEAVETALKAARRYGHQVKNIPENQAEIIVMAQNFHGRTIGIISFSSEPSYQKGFGPFLPGFKVVPFGDINALKEAITPNTCAVLTEPIQGEAGIILPPSGWLKQVEQLCRQHKIALIVDEIQSGLGRTGRILACEHEDVQPDAVILGKALGGGVLPISVLVGRSHIMDVFNPGSHGSTFGGNPLAAAVALEALHILEEENLSEHSTKMGEYLMMLLRQIDSPLIKNLRGIGLWIGLEIDPKLCKARKICEELAQVGILSKETHETVVRLAPPLTINREEIEWGVQRIQAVLLRDPLGA